MHRTISTAVAVVLLLCTQTRVWACELIPNGGNSRYLQVGADDHNDFSSFYDNGTFADEEAVEDQYSSAYSSQSSNITTSGVGYYGQIGAAGSAAAESYLRANFSPDESGTAHMGLHIYDAWEGEASGEAEAVIRVTLTDVGNGSSVIGEWYYVLVHDRITNFDDSQEVGLEQGGAYQFEVQLVGLSTTDDGPALNCYAEVQANLSFSCD